MRAPIAYALHHPERVPVPIEPLDLAAHGRLDFEPVDVEAFPCLRLAREVGIAGGTAPCVLNAANEIAVHAFLNGRLDFLGISDVIAGTLDELPGEPIRAFETLYAADHEARAVATGLSRRRHEPWRSAYAPREDGGRRPRGGRLGLGALRGGRLPGQGPAGARRGSRRRPPGRA